MDVKVGLFYAFSGLLLFAAFRVITARSTVHAALFLVLAFFSASCIWMLLAAEFLAITLVLVYVGAVMVLFLFVVMMLDINTDSFREGFWKHFPLAGFVGALIALEMALVLTSGFRVTDVPPADPAAMATAIGKLVADPNYRRRMGEKGRQRVGEKFNILTMTDRIVSVYQRIAQQKNTD